MMNEPSVLGELSELGSVLGSADGSAIGSDIGSMIGKRMETNELEWNVKQTNGTSRRHLALKAK